MAELEFHSHSEADTERLGAALARALPPGTTIALIGTLGAGKTRLVQAVAAACGVPREIATSPTFVIVNEYRGTRPIYHFDAYRLRDEDEFIELGPEEYFESEGLTFVEWADRVESCMPRERVEIACDAVGETERRFVVTASPTLAHVLDEMRSRLSPRP
jgi:tRNA threonylcarbamoyladenosine biosynthesis protein TsaE